MAAPTINDSLLMKAGESQVGSVLWQNGRRCLRNIPNDTSGTRYSTSACREFLLL